MIPGAIFPIAFPVIAAFEDGTAVMIKSLNHTLPSYHKKWRYGKGCSQNDRYAGGFSREPNTAEFPFEKRISKEKS